MQLSSLAPCLATFPNFLLLFLKWLRAFISKQVASERDGGKKSHWNLNWLSMLCGSPLKRETNRGSCWVTWPTRLMCASGEDKEKRNNPFETPALSLARSLCPSQPLSSMEPIRRKQVWCLLQAHIYHREGDVSLHFPLGCFWIVLCRDTLNLLCISMYFFVALSSLPLTFRLLVCHWLLGLVFAQRRQFFGPWEVQPESMTEGLNRALDQ